MNAPVSLAGRIESAAQASSEWCGSITFVGGDDAATVPWIQLHHDARAVAAGLQRRGYGVGAHVAILGPTTRALVTAIQATWLIGATSVLLPLPMRLGSLDEFVVQTRARVAHADIDVVLVDGDLAPFLTTEPGDPPMIALSDAMPGATGVPTSDAFDPVGADPTSLAILQFTSGSTSEPKGVMLPHQQVCANLDAIQVGCGLVAGQDVAVSWLPLYHDMGLIACFILPLVYHLPVVLQSPTDWVMHPGTMLELITEYRCTLAWMPNFALQFLARRVRLADRERCDLSPLRVLINCSEPIRAHSMDEFSNAYSAAGLRPNALQTSYAMAENVFAVTQSGIAEPPKRIWVDGVRLRGEHIAEPVASNALGAVCLVSSGTCLPENRIAIESVAGVPLPPGEVGEIVISGDSLFVGYYNRPDLTAEALHNGSYKTGDLGFVLDEELYVIGRKKDLIIVAGKNIYPQDVEEIVSTHPEVRDGRAVAMGIFNSELGTEDIVVVAEVGKEEALANAGEIERWVRNAIVAELGVAARAVYLKPPSWIVKSTAGKAARSSTCDKLLSEHPELVSSN